MTAEVPRGSSSFCACASAARNAAGKATAHRSIAPGRSEWKCLIQLPNESPSKSRSFSDAEAGRALDKFKLYRGGCKPKWLCRPAIKLEHPRKLRVSCNAAHLLFSAACQPRVTR